MTGGNAAAPGAEAWLLHLETASNQDFIFATNKVREIVGASQLTVLAGVGWVIEGLRRLPAGGSGERLGAALAGLATEERGAVLSAWPALEEQGDDGVEALTLVSGLARLAFRSEGEALAVASAVTRKAIESAPGLDVAAGISAVRSLDSGEDVRTAIRTAAQRSEDHRRALMGADTRFQRLPLVAECATSGLPAAVYDSGGPEPGYRSARVLAKRAVAEEGIGRMQEAARSPEGRSDGQAELFRSIDELEAWLEEDERLRWIAVVHADGTGVGQLFLSLAETGDGASVRRGNRELSVALDRCAEGAFQTALTALDTKPGERHAVVPLVLGGDDLTAIVAGDRALSFARAYLEAFESMTGADPTITKLLGDLGAIAGRQQAADVRELLEELGAAGRLSARAGVAIVKARFPFSAAYELAAALADKAKGAKRRLGPTWSAFDFHVLYDASGGALSPIRKRLRIGEATLHGRPYLLGDQKRLAGARDPVWARAHHISQLDNRIDALETAMRPSKDGRPPLSRSQLARVRESLRLGRRGADAQMAVARKRHPGLAALAEDADGSTVFYDDGDGERTRLLDVLEMLEVEQRGRLPMIPEAPEAGT